MKLIAKKLFLDVTLCIARVGNCLLFTPMNIGCSL